MKTVRLAHSRVRLINLEKNSKQSSFDVRERKRKFVRECYVTWTLNSDGRNNSNQSLYLSDSLVFFFLSHLKSFVDNFLILCSATVNFRGAFSDQPQISCSSPWKWKLIGFFFLTKNVKILGNKWCSYLKNEVLLDVVRISFICCPQICMVYLARELCRYNVDSPGALSYIFILCLYWTI